MQLTRYAVAALLGTILMVSGCRQDKPVTKYQPATVEETDQEGIMKVTLDARAAERIGLETAPVKEENVTVGGRSATRKVVPYGALMYDKKGGTWAFTSPEPLVFIRKPIEVERIEGDRLILTEGPPVGTVVVTVGAAELMGAENKYGH